ncbi:gluconolaconase [Luteimonas sp. BDR2-5]|uniref:Vgb family protein n=1 Tax=Proluteimonas luteida TaxID=2878685 RepID=UPI001E2D9CCF|nr:gluconolaconase [Luteimonas sp. BDR2-5]MCD9027647.1 gluconolaconase [Luteimonas sp. BDR2-5]
MSRAHRVLAALAVLAWTAALPVLARDVPVENAPARDTLLVGNKSDDTVWRLDLDSGRRIAELASGTGPHEIAVAADGRMAVVTDYGRGAPGASLTVVDLRTQATRSVDLGDHRGPHGIRLLADGRTALVTTERSGSLLRVDLAQGAVRDAIDVGDGTGHMVALSRDGATAFVSKIATGTVSRIDLASGTKIGERPAGEGAEGIEVAPDGTVWVTNRAEDTVTVHDPDTLDIVATLPSAGFPIRVAFTPDGRHALVTNARAATLSVFDAATRVAVATVDLAPPDAELHETMLGRGALPIGVIADPVRPRVYVAVSGADRIAVVDTGDWTVRDYWPTGREPDALGLVPVEID